MTLSVNLRHLQQRGSTATLSHLTQPLPWHNDLDTVWDAALPPAWLAGGQELCPDHGLRV